MNSKRAPGRPPVPPELKAIQVGMRLPAYIWRHLSQMDGANSGLIVQALIHRYKIPKPGARKRGELVAAKDDPVSRVTFTLPLSCLEWLDKLAADNHWCRNKALSRLLRMESRRGQF